MKDERHAEAFWNSVSLAREDALPLGERASALGQKKQATRVPGKVKLGPGGSREISFVSRSLAKSEKEEQREGKRRGVQSLRLKPDRSGFEGKRGRGGRGGGRGRSRGGSRGRGRR